MYRLVRWSVAIALLVLYSLTAPQNHSEAEDVYDFALRVEQGTVAEQAAVNRVLALPVFGAAYRVAQTLGYPGRALPFMIFLNRLIAIVCVCLFFNVMGRSLSQRKMGSADNEPPNTSIPHQPHKISAQLTPALCLAFSYGFWRYANEAETYLLAGMLVLGAWYLTLKGKWLWAAACSGVGILVHLLNLIPLLLIIPLYHLLSKDWKMAVRHGVLTAALVVIGYFLFAPALDFAELGARHHRQEAGLGLGNVLRGTIGFGQCLLSGNFLFGFEAFRELLVQMFPSRMLDEEFFTASRMPVWIQWVGILTLSMCAACSLCLGVKICGGMKAFWNKRYEPETSSNKPLAIAVLVWFACYALAIIRTEAGSPELWIMALIPFWIILAPVLQGRLAILLVGGLFVHNLIAGLLPVMAEKSDYHVQKGRWLVENTVAGDQILISYEPVMIFYLDYFTPAEIINSGNVSLEEIEQILVRRQGNVYVPKVFFTPLESMRMRYPSLFSKMCATGDALRPRFEKKVEDEFGGIFTLTRTGDANE